MNDKRMQRFDKMIAARACMALITASSAMPNALTRMQAYSGVRKAD